MDFQQPNQQQPDQQQVNQRQPDQNIQPNPVVVQPPKNIRKIVVLTIIGVLILGSASYGAYYWWPKNNKPVACTQEAKLCPDGSYIGRTGPNCEFVPCPEQKSETAKLTPEATIEGYAKALKIGDIDGALKYVSIDAQERQRDFLTEVDVSGRTMLADSILNSKKISESDGMIQYKGEMKLPDGRVIEDTFDLVRENGSWKISGL